MSNVKLMQPQEIEVLYILPAIRREMAKTLKDNDVPQKNIAELLHVKESTISQYLSGKRGHEVQFNEKIKNYINECTLKIKNGDNMIMHTQSILHLIRMENVLCEVHKRFSDIPKECNVRLMGCC